MKKTQTKKSHATVPLTLDLKKFLFVVGKNYLLQFLF